ncbi:Ig-like domain-containing protein [Sphaerisporangium sp. NPDC049002]|uniref:Ig-like domain-containing protein n=1 Tax=Sphaerisporangium sp. NPDC049002 TaxID=3155392 RepID=UPI00340A4411
MATSLLIGTGSLPASAAPAPSPTPPVAAAEVDPVELAKREAKKQNKRVEITSYRSETSTTFANPDGKTLHMEMSTSPVRVKRNGAWEAIDTTLVVQGNMVKPRVAKSDLVLSYGGKTDLLKASTDPARSDGEDDKAQVFAPEKLPTPRLSGNRAEFASAYGIGTDLVVTATPTGFRQQIVIRQRPVKPLTLRVPIDLPANFAFKNTSGKTMLVKNTGKGNEDILDISTTMMVDAVATDSSSGPDEGRAGKATTSLEKTAGGSTLVLTPDAGFLADPAVTYPVTVAAATSDWWAPKVVSDTFVNNAAYPISRDNQLLDRILVGKSNSGTVRWRSYIGFEDIPADSSLRGGKVQNADLVLWNHLSNDCGTSVGSGITARRITSSWSPNTLTWDNQPSVTSTGADTEYGAYSPDCTKTYMNYEWDLYHSVNTIVQAWADGQPNYGFQLTAGNESDLTNWRRYRTTEYRVCNNGTLCEGKPHQPLLFVDFEPAPEFDIAYERDGEPDNNLPSYEEVLANQVPLTDILQPQPVSVEEAASRQANSKATFSVSSDEFPSEPPLEDDPEIDTTAPGVVATYPTKDAANVPLSAYITASFSERVTGTQMVVKDASGTALAGTLTANPAGDVFSVTPSAILTPDTTYTVEVSGAKDFSGNVMTPHSWSFTTAPPDTTAPTVMETIPGDAASGVPVTTPVTVKFSEQVLDAQVAVTGPASSTVTGTTQMDTAGKVLTFTPSQSLNQGTTYTVEVSGAKDFSGNVMTPHSWSFTTAPPDTTAPTVTETIPGDAASGVPVTTPVTVKFSEQVLDAQVAVTGPASSMVTGTTQMDTAGKVLTFTPSQSLNQGTTYTVEVSGAKDFSGNVMTPHSWSFSTVNSGLVAAYGMNEGTGTTVSDASGQNNTGTTTNTTWVNGKYGKALAFNDSSGSSVRVPHSSSLRLTGGMTLSAWVNPTSISGYRTVMMKDHVNGSAYGLYASNGTVPSAWLLKPDAASHNILNGTTGLPVNTWSHVAVTYDGTMARLFVNGTQVSQLPMTGSLVDDGGALRLGGNTKWGEFFSGLIDEVRVYNRSLNAAQIQGDMNTPVVTTSAAAATRSAASSRSAAATTRAALSGPSPTWSGNRIKFEDCWGRPEATDRKNYPHGWVRDSYNWCSVRTVGKARVQDLRDPCGCKYKVKGKLEFLFSVAGHTFAGGRKGTAGAEVDQNNGGINSRTVHIWARVDKIKASGTGSYLWPDSTLLGVQMPAAASAGMDCQQLAGGRNVTLAEWRNSPQEYFEYLSNKNASRGPHKLSVCTFTPQLIVPPHANQRGVYINTKMADEPVRCDTSEQIKDYYGGCVFGEFIPTFEVPMIYEYKNGHPVMNESADLIRRALEETKDTYPKKTDEPKVIPGTPKTGPLHRTASIEIDKANRALSKTYCAQMLVDLGNLPKPLDRDCDEFPFAASHEGSKEDGNRNVAVDYIFWDHNQSVGRKLRWFWQTFRVFGSDVDGVFRWHPFESFYVKIPNY